MSGFLEANMEVLRALEAIRTPLLDVLLATVTHLGEETYFMVGALFIFWCVGKRQGYYLLTVGFFGTIFSQFLKIFCRIPRPWVLDEKFTIVESARAEATGYSFPSGHTQSAVGLFGGVARFTRRWWLRCLLIVLTAVIAFSRLYLGVHTPLDVGVSLLVTVTLVFVIYPIIQRTERKPQTMYTLLGVMLVLAAVSLAYVSFWQFPADVDAENYAHAVKNAYSMLGATLGVWVVYWLDERFLRFETDAVWWAQVLKLVLGLALVLAVKTGLKAPLLALCGGHLAAHGIRYFLMVLTAGAVWPATFRWFSTLGGGRRRK